MKLLFGLMIAILINGISGGQLGNSPEAHLNIGIEGGVNLYKIHNEGNTKYN